MTTPVCVFQGGGGGVAGTVLVQSSQIYISGAQPRLLELA